MPSRVSFVTSSATTRQRSTASKRPCELDPKNARIHYDFGHALRLHGKLDEAAAAFREALRLKPDTAGARDALAWVLNRLAWSLATDPEPHVVTRDVR